METIKDVVLHVIEDLETKKLHPEIDQPQAWLKKVLTKRELSHIKFNYFRKGVLGLWVDSSSWLYGLNLKKEDLLGKLRANSGAIKDIHFRIGEVK
jgi:hypothetical protein